MSTSAPKQVILARLPLQIGTSSTWGAARASLALFPGVACLAALVWLATELFDGGGDGAQLLVFPGVLGALFLYYAYFYTRIALDERASDLVLSSEGIHVHGGNLDDTRLAWSELTTPFAKVETGITERLILWKLPWAALMAMGEGGEAEPARKLPIWKLTVWKGGKKLVLAQTDRRVEAQSFKAAVSSITSVMGERSAIAHAPQVKPEFAICSACAAPLIPQDSPTVVCAYCRATVALAPRVQQQASAIHVIEKARERTTGRIAKLLAQPGARSANLWLLAMSLVMVGAWPLGWGAIVSSVMQHGVHARDFLYGLLPFSAVFAGFFIARGQLADRGALQLLTLGFGALPPGKDGEPPLCRRCHGPLLVQGLGGIVRCGYCQAENIAGLDLRRVVDDTRGSDSSFEATLAAHNKELWVWRLLSLVAVLVLVGWLWATTHYSHGFGP